MENPLIDAYCEGYLSALREMAWTKNGVTYVSVEGQTLEQATAEFVESLPADMRGYAETIIARTKQEASRES